MPDPEFPETNAESAPIFCNAPEYRSHMLPYFESDHLPDHLKVISKPFEKLLILMHELIVDCDSSTAMDFEQFEIGVHDLLRAKDCFVRARLSMDQ